VKKVNFTNNMFKRKSLWVNRKYKKRW
jgi:hypothetical protein